MRKEIRAFFKQFSRTPTPEELTQALLKTKGTLVQEIKRMATNAFKSIYAFEQGKLQRELRVDLAFTNRDSNAIEALKNQQVLSRAFSKIGDKIGSKIREIIEESYKSGQLNRRRMEAKIEEIARITQGRARTIVRIETSKVQMAARVTSYKKVLDFETELFEHFGPDDYRTTGTSKRIVRRTRGGVPWKEYVRIVTEEAAKDFPTWTVNPDAPVSHWNSRHMPRRVVRR